MSFVVREFAAAAGDRSGVAYELTHSTETVRAEVWPQWGFNCLRWQLRQPDGRWADVLHCAPDWESNPVPTRSGHPILFPFPGRLRDGTFTHDGRTYQLPLNDSTKSHAIHGFTPRNPWRVVGTAATDTCAAIEGVFSLRDDLPAALGSWPGDFQLAVRYELELGALRVIAGVHNRGPNSLPFGLGYHPYFRLPGVPDEDVGGHVLRANVSHVWEAEDNLPTGRKLELPQELDFRQPRPIGGVALDHVFTGVSPPTAAVLSHPQAMCGVRFVVGPSFRDLVLFTPPHRRAIAVEPYTCSADAANLTARGVSCGWQDIPAGSLWSDTVEYRLEPPEL